MTTKTFEVRDRGTFIPVIAIRLDPADERDRYLLARAGYGKTPDEQSTYVFLLRLNDPHYDPFSHDTSSRTMKYAHLHVVENFNDLANGAVVDVEHVLGEKPMPKESEQVSG